MQCVATIVEHEGELAMIFPDELLSKADWKVGDELDWHVRDNTIVLTKAELPMSQTAPA